jgi:hypothetical protein
MFHNYFLNGTVFGNNLPERICILSFPPQLSSKKFIISGRIQRVSIIGILRSSRKMDDWSYFKQTWMFVTDFSIITQYKFSRKSFDWEPGCPMRTERRNLKKITVNFTNLQKCLRSNEFRSLSLFQSSVKSKKPLMLGPPEGAKFYHRN